MNHQLTGLIIDTLGALLMMALAVWVWRVRPQARLNRAFAALVSVFALAIILLNVGWAFHYAGQERGLMRNLGGGLGGVFMALAGFLAVRLTHVFVAQERDRAAAREHLVPIIVAVLFFLAGLPHPVRFGVSMHADATATVFVGRLLNEIGFGIFGAATLYLVGRLAFFYRRAGIPAALRWQASAVAVAIAASPMYISAAGTLDLFGPGNAQPIDALVLVPMVMAALTWLWAAARHDGRLAVLTALALLGLILAGLSVVAMYGIDMALNSGILGALRLLGTALLAYAILRHQLFDIDLKIKWGIRRGTLVAIFVAAFIATSEIVSELVTESSGPWAGIGATALLVLALGPLQRLADRIADRAMPNVRSDDSYRAQRRRELYESAVRAALTDGIISAEERDMLAALADHLQLTAGEARALERGIGSSFPEHA